jgi:hypothetical protein
VVVEGGRLLIMVGTSVLTLPVCPIGVDRSVDFEMLENVVEKPPVVELRLTSILLVGVEEGSICTDDEVEAVLLGIGRVPLKLGDDVLILVPVLSAAEVLPDDRIWDWVIVVRTAVLVLADVLILAQLHNEVLVLEPLFTFPVG